MRFPKIGSPTPLGLLSLGVLLSSGARGIDFIISPPDMNATMVALTDWASPTVLGFLLVTFAVLALIGMIIRSAPVQGISHMALAALFLVMGAVSLVPVVVDVGWGWRTSVTYILGSGVTHWFCAHSWLNRWMDERGTRLVK